jgi:betaine-homocysteine S-methyltransferase
MASGKKRTILERLDAGEVIIGDGGFVFGLEKRGYLKAGPWTPEVCVEHPEAVRELHKEYARAGADIMQALTFYGSDDKLDNRGNLALSKYGGSTINAAACKLAKEVAEEYGCFFLGGVCQTPTYLTEKSTQKNEALFKESVKNTFRKQMQVFKDEGVDLILCEYFEHVEECELAIETAKEFDLPVAATMCIGPEGDMNQISTAECGLRMAKAGAHIIGVNCHYDPWVCLEAMKLMIDAVKAAGLKVHFMVQPLAYLTPDANRQGFIDLPEFPFGLEPRLMTRFEMAKYARQAYEMGIRVIGGCCGYESYHIRAVSEELAAERGGKMPISSEKHEPWGGGLKQHTKPWVRARANREYWEKLHPATGRPHHPAYSTPDGWNLEAGSELLQQKSEATTAEELEAVRKLKQKS